MGQIFKNYNRRGLVGHWKYHGNVSALGTWYDVSGNGNHGTLVGNALVNKDGVNLDGSGDSVEIANSTSININRSNPITLSVWINLSSTNFSASPVIIAKGGSGYWIYLNSSNKIALYFKGTQTSSVLSWSTGVWYMITVTKDSSGNWIIYRDATSVGSGSGVTIGSDSDSLYIGSDRGTEGNYFNGYIDDVRIYNRALSASEISQLYYQTRR